jgi:hypothetical protein
MRIFSPTLMAVVLASAALPVVAQPTVVTALSAPASWKPLAERQDQVAEQLTAGVATGALSDRQADELRDQFKGLLHLEDQYRKTGLTPAQQADLQARYDTLEARIQVNSHPASIEVRRAPADAPD